MTVSSPKLQVAHRSARKPSHGRVGAGPKHNLEPGSWLKWSRGGSRSGERRRDAGWGKVNSGGSVSSAQTSSAERQGRKKPGSFFFFFYPDVWARTFGCALERVRACEETIKAKQKSNKMFKTLSCASVRLLSPPSSRKETERRCSGSHSRPPRVSERCRCVEGKLYVVVIPTSLHNYCRWEGAEDDRRALTAAFKPITVARRFKMDLIIRSERVNPERQVIKGFWQ